MTTWRSLHVEVTAFHDTHLDRCTATTATLLGKGEKVTLEVPGVVEVSLHHDSSRIMKELRLGQRSLEDANREVEVLILLHVEVDELRPFVTLLVYIRIVDSRLIEALTYGARGTGNDSS